MTIATKSPSGAAESGQATATLTLGVLALMSTTAVLAAELSRVRNRQRQEPRRHSVAPVGAATPRTHTRQALLGMLGAFGASLAGIRGLTHLIHKRGRLGPLGNLTIGNRHIHHFVPGILVAFCAGATAILSSEHPSAARMAVPFGAGLALTLDEAALLLDLDDVYWSAEGRVSIQIALAVLSGLSAAVLVLGPDDAAI